MPTYYFQGASPHRDLHSFPTRRSSDLTVRSRKRRVSSRTISRTSTSRSGGSTVTARTVRSEEHTSELQSLRHLVCRLLLEIKNKHESIPSALPSFTTMFKRSATAA